MGLKGELGDGFPQPKPAFIIGFDWDAAHMLGNQLSYTKLRGTVRSVNGSGLPPLVADFVDGGSWVQQEVLPSGKTGIKFEGFGLLRVVEPPNTSADPAVAETETGLIRLKFSGVGAYSETLKPGLENDVPELLRVTPKEDEPGSTGALIFSFQTGDPRYKYLEHAVFVGKSRLVVVPAENAQEESKVVHETRLSYLAA